MDSKRKVIFQSQLKADAMATYGDYNAPGKLKLQILKINDGVINDERSYYYW